MSHSSPPGDYSSITTHRSIDVISDNRAHNPATSTPATSEKIKRDPHGDTHSASSSIGFADVASVRHDGQRASPDSTSQTPSRSLGVHSILNPSTDRSEPGSGPISIPKITSLGQTLHPTPVQSPRSRKRPGPGPDTDALSPSQYEISSADRVPRRILTPRSPGSGPAENRGRRNPTFHSTVTGPTIESRMYPYGAKSEIPPLPTSLSARPPLSGGHEPTEFQPRPPFGSTAPLSGMPLVESPANEGPGPVQYNARDSPRYRYDPAPGPPVQPPPTAFRVLPAGPVVGGFSHDQSVHGPHEGYQTGQASYQMTLDTDQGPMVVPVELDLQQASKVADEKRKRNAGASARFRARRKEKEKEASSTISGLQQELRELAEQRDFYRNERDYFRDVAAKYVGASQMPPRPASPPVHRMIPPPDSEASSLPSIGDRYRSRSESLSAVQRRRTGDYQPTFIGHSPTEPSSATLYRQPPPTLSIPTGPPPPHLPPSAGPPPGAFVSQGPLPPLNLPPPAPSNHGPFTSPGTLTHSLPPNPSSMPRTSSYDPFRRDPFDRNWNPGR